MHPKKILAAVSVYVVVISVFGCASSPKRSNAADSKSSQDHALEEARSSDTPDAREYETMDAQYRAHDFDSVVKRSKVFLKTYHESSFADHVYNLRGLAHIGLKQYDAAISALKKTLEMTKDDGLRNMASYNIAYAYFEMGQVNQASQHLDSIKSSELTRSDRYKLSVLKAKIARIRQDHVGSAENVLGALKHMPEPRSAGAMEPLLNFLDEVLEPLSTGTNIVALERILSDFEDSPAADRLLYKIGGFYFNGGDREKGRKYFEKIVSSFPESKHYASARDHLKKFEHQGVVNPRRIGVLLTLSGKFGKFGYKALQGIEMALKIFQPSSDPNPVTLVVMDDQGEPDRAMVAMEELYFKHNVSAIIGPLVSKLAEPVGRKAQDLGIPLIALSQKEAVGGDFIFNAALTPAMQVRELIRYATEKVGARNFVMLAPNGKFGEEYSKAFWDELDRNACSVRGFETYPNDETDFRQYVDRVVGLSQPDARAHEVEELRLLKAATPVKGRSKKFDRMFELKPIVDFQAVFIPDEPKALGQILPTFAYRDVENVLFLGINTWNSQELIARAGQFAEGSVFVDGFYAGSQQPSTRKFIEEYQQTYRMEPSLVEALAYDAAHILATLMRKGDVNSRAQLRDRILDLRDFPGVSGKISYQAGRLTKHLNFLTVKGGKIEEIAFQ